MSCNVEYSGVVDPKYIRYTTGGDGLPGVAIIHMSPQRHMPAEVGTLKFTDGFETLTLTNCRVNRASTRYNQYDLIESIEVFDRQWTWEHSVIDGVYNVPLPDGTVAPGTEKTPRQLAELLFKAMGESSYDLQQLPSNVNDRPYVNWNCASARAELAWLCSRRGCWYGLDPYSDKAGVFRIAQGGTLPNNEDVQSVDHSVPNELPPNKIRVCHGETRYQAKIRLRARLVDTDGKVVPSANASFTPAGGWLGANPVDPIGAGGVQEHSQLARRHYLKLWEPVSMSNGSLYVPGYGRVPGIEYLYPLSDKLANSYNSVTGNQWEQRAYLEGTFAEPGEVSSLSNSSSFTRIDTDFYIDQNNLIHTKDPLAQLTSGQWDEAEVYLVTSFSITHPVNFQKIRHFTERVVDSRGVGTIPIPRPDLILNKITLYSGGQANGSATNQSVIERAANAHLDAIQQEYVQREAYVVKYRGIQRIGLTGQIRQLTFVVSSRKRDKGAWTWGSQNMEGEVGVPRRRERLRMMESIRQLGIKEQSDFKNGPPPIRT